jgi:hypothetical protein
MSSLIFGVEECAKHIAFFDPEDGGDISLRNVG